MWKGDLWNDVAYIRDYQPYKVGGERNPQFGPADGLLLDLKDNHLNGIVAATEAFSNVLAAEALPARHAWVALVPGHQAKDTNAGTALARVIAALTAHTATHGQLLIDFADGLLRHTSVAKLAVGGDRSIEGHLRTLRVGEPGLVKGECIIVLDDVSTTRNSLRAARQLFLAAGAASVAALALGQTIKIY